MGRNFGQLRLAVVNVDGVLLNDTFSPVIHDFIVSRGGQYTAETERAIFSQPQQIAGVRMAEAVPEPLTGEQALRAYFEEREKYLERHPVALSEGAVELLHRLRRLGLQVVCYGGLATSHFEAHLGAYSKLLDGPGYVCTNDFRPGIHEIITQTFGLKQDEAVVIDDVARVAEEARALNVAFIGHPSRFVHSFQRQLMVEAGVQHIVSRLDQVDAELLRHIDAAAASGRSWER
ncbi:HAD family phosphatase [Streptomyces angustmyceticus]|uniref:HAD family phosphatase n=1 Tax=Streptomyces angustmyceticus TaxID=285578 RepID=UPI003450C52F